MKLSDGRGYGTYSHGNIRGNGAGDGRCEGFSDGSGLGYGYDGQGLGDGYGYADDSGSGGGNGDGYGFGELYGRSEDYPDGMIPGGIDVAT
jgi:hypothetical protein